MGNNMNCFARKTTHEKQLIRPIKKNVNFDSEKQVNRENVPNTAARARKYIPIFKEVGEEITDTNSAVLTSNNNKDVALPNDSVCTNSNCQTLSATIIPTENLPINFEYKELQKMTQDFSEKLFYNHDLKRLVGKIGFNMFVGFHGDIGHLSIKKIARPHYNLISDFELFESVLHAEIKILSELRHKNVLQTIGLSTDGPDCYVLCEFISGKETLQDKIAAKRLTELQRVDIVIGVAEALNYLYCVNRSIENSRIPVMHGRVRTSHILLTMDLVPKLHPFNHVCNHQLADFYDRYFTAYAAPESSHGSLTSKIDIYSFGVVILEVLTGLGPVVTIDNIEMLKLKDFVDEYSRNNGGDYFDPSVEGWTKGKELYALARQCLALDRRRRPDSTQLVDRLKKIRRDLVR